MTVMATPVGAAISDVKVTVTNPIAATPSAYTITFKMQQPVDPAFGDFIDVVFPTGTGLGALVAGDVLVNGAAEPFVVIGADTLRISPAVLVPAGTVTVVVGVVNLVVNPPPCYHTLLVGTSQETTVESAQYKIYLFDIGLLVGWNLISLPGIPEDPAIEEVLADLITKAAADPTFTFTVWYYDCGTWYVYNNGDYATLTEMHDGASYWIEVSAAATFKVKGVWYPEPPGPPLKYCYHECWNMVGFTDNAASTVAIYTAALAPAGAIFYWMGWNAATQTWTVSPALAVGQGYWMAFGVNACFAPPP